MKDLSAIVRKQFRKNMWLVLATVNEKQQPQSSLVIYQSDGQDLYIQTGKITVKAKNIMKNNKVSVTIPIYKNLFHTLIPAPPAEIHFKGTAEILPFEDEYARGVFKKYLKHELPEELQKESIWLKISPSKQVNTYGLGVKLWSMQDPTKARKVVDIS
jgi:hypothetical protein